MREQRCRGSEWLGDGTAAAMQREIEMPVGTSTYSQLMMITALAAMPTAHAQQVAPLPYESQAVPPTISTTAGTNPAVQAFLKPIGAPSAVDRYRRFHETDAHVEMESRADFRAASPAIIQQASGGSQVVPAQYASQVQQVDTPPSLATPPLAGDHRAADPYQAGPSASAAAAPATAAAPASVAAATTTSSWADGSVATVGNSSFVSAPVQFASTFSAIDPCAPVAGVPYAGQATIAPPTITPAAAPEFYRGAEVGYQPLFTLGQNANVVLGRGIIGQPVAYVPGQAFRNFLRYISP